MGDLVCVCVCFLFAQFTLFLLFFFELSVFLFSLLSYYSTVSRTSRERHSRRGTHWEKDDIRGVTSKENCLQQPFILHPLFFSDPNPQTPHPPLPHAHLEV